MLTRICSNCREQKKDDFKIVIIVAEDLPTIHKEFCSECIKKGINLKLRWQN